MWIVRKIANGTNSTNSALSKEQSKYFFHQYKTSFYSIRLYYFLFHTHSYSKKSIYFYIFNLIFGNNPLYFITYSHLIIIYMYMYISSSIYFFSTWIEYSVTIFCISSNVCVVCMIVWICMCVCKLSAHHILIAIYFFFIFRFELKPSFFSRILWKEFNKYFSKRNRKRNNHIPYIALLFSHLQLGFNWKPAKEWKRKKISNLMHKNNDRGDRRTLSITSFIFYSLL